MVEGNQMAKGISHLKIFLTVVISVEKSQLAIDTKITETQNHRMVWVVMDIKDYLVPSPLPWAGR